MAALRDHGDRAWPSYSVVNGALSAPCAHAGGLLTSTQSTASWVADLRPGSPAGGRHWVTGTSAPCTSLFKPVTVGEPVAPDGGDEATDRFDPRFLWWRHEIVHRQLVRDAERLLPACSGERDELERGWLADPPAGADAFAAGDAWDARWADRLRSDGPAGDHRPAWVRRQWQRWDRAAGIAPGARSEQRSAG